MALWQVFGFALEESDLSGFRRGRTAQAQMALSAGHTMLQAAAELDGGITVEDAVRTIAIQLLARRAVAGLFDRVVVKVLWLIERWRFVGRSLVPQRSGLGLVFFLICKARIALTHAVVGDQRVDTLLCQCLEIGFAVIARVGRDE